GFMQVTEPGTSSQSLVAAVHRATGGNPFFLQEVVRVLRARGTFEAAGSPAQEAFGVPLRVRETVRRRLELLSADCGVTLPVAAVIGQEFDRAVLAQACALPAPRLAEMLDEAIRAGVLVQLGGPRHAFFQGIMREALYETIPPGERAQLHGRIGELLEGRSSNDPEAHLGELAYHFGEAAQGGADPAKAVTYARQAAEQALR